MNLGVFRRRRAFLANDALGSGRVSGTIWKDDEECIVVRRSEWEALKRENAELKAENQELKRQLAQALDKLDVLTARVAELEEKLRTSSSNSSKPPSSDPPWAKKPPKRKKGKRKRGGQKGHEGKARKLLPPEEVDTFVDCPPPTECECGGHVAVTGDIAERRQVFELPKVKAHVTEYRFLEGVCQGCGKHHRSGIPDGVPAGMLTIAVWQGPANRGKGYHWPRSDRGGHRGFGTHPSIIELRRFQERTAGRGRMCPEVWARQRRRPVCSLPGATGRLRP